MRIYSPDVHTYIHVCTCPSRSGMSLIDMRMHSWAGRIGDADARPTVPVYS